uniref:Movement protein n=1 Tax=Suakwa aphid-borne yellows virus TaxID=646010 RepID=W8E461_9VIRU|nr:movement protein [Suakwa aphid-borne yellows virus]AHJ60012.1 movement protein [Suakwa aphid-borne yellows virus]AHJ60015.1 movement protein [Suakwa aphid-borne yellows virus]
MAWEEGEGLAGAMQKATAWLWSKPLGLHSAEDDEEETVDALLEEAELEEQAKARHLFSVKAISRAAPPDQSLSGRLYQRAQHSALEYSRPTMSIKSQWLSWSSSPRPLPPPQAPSLMSWTPIASLAPSNPRLINLESPRVDQEHGALSSSTGLNGTTPRRISSGSCIKETERLPRRDLLELPSSAKSRTRNR